MIHCLTGYCAALSREGGCRHVDAEQVDHGTPHEGGDTDVGSKEDWSLAQEDDPLPRETRILKAERDILKKQRRSLRAKSREVQVRPLPGRVMQGLIPIRKKHRDVFQAARLCRVMDVSMRGLRAFRTRPAAPCIAAPG